MANFSSLNRMYNITAWIMRFMNNANSKNLKIFGPLITSEIEIAEKYWIKQTQETSFKLEIDALKQKKPLNKDSSLYNLNPQLDENNLLVFSGRLQFSDVTGQEKHPWILPKKSYFVKLLINLLTAAN